MEMIEPCALDLRVDKASSKRHEKYFEKNKGMAILSAKIKSLHNLDYTKNYEDVVSQLV